MEQATEWTMAVAGAFQAALGGLLAFLPKAFGFLIILIVGWLVASAIASGVAVLLRKVQFNEFASKAGIATFIERSQLRNDASGLFAFVIKWFIRLVVLVVAFDVLGLPVVSETFNQFLRWMPNLLVAMIILVLGGWAANAVRALIRGGASTLGASNTEMLASIGTALIWVLTVIVAVNQLGVASELVQMLFAAFVGALALGLGLAVGLGGKDLAGELLRKWYDQSCCCSGGDAESKKELSSKKKAPEADPEAE